MSKRLQEVDRLRAVAVLAVLFVHAGDYLQIAGHMNNWWLNFFSALRVGVGLFFVISGFVVSSVLIPKLDAAREQNWSATKTLLKQFYLRRFTRLMPMAWLVIGCALLTLWLQEGQSARFNYSLAAASAALSFWINYFIFLHPPPQPDFSIFGHYWSLAIEEQFYAVYPLFLILVVSPRKRVWSLGCVLTILACIVRPLHWDAAMQTANIRVALTTHMHLDGLIFGCLLYAASFQPWYKTLIPWSRFGARITSGLIFLLFFGMMAGFLLPKSLVFPVQALLGVMIVHAATLDQNLVLPKAHRFLQWMGTRSYSLYLVNWPVLWLLHNGIWQGLDFTVEWIPGMLLLWVLLSLALSDLCYRWVEAPGMRLGQRLSERWVKKAPVQKKGRQR